MRRNLLRYLQTTSAERALVLRSLFKSNPGMADVLAELEADKDLRLRVEQELLRQGRSSPFADEKS